MPFEILITITDDTLETKSSKKIYIKWYFLESLIFGNFNNLPKE